ncbi:MAG: gliding motility-associated C-terminal domain-containing protein [Chitinophagales bacterium]
MKRIIPSIFVFGLLLISVVSLAQAGRDGNMRVTVKVNNLWTNDDGPAELGANEMQQRFKLRDYPNLDGNDWFYYPGGGTSQAASPYQYDVGDFDAVPYTKGINEQKIFTYGSPNTLGPNPAPLGLQWGFEGWQANCYDCFRCTGTFLGICTSGACDQCQRDVYHNPCNCSTVFNIFCLQCSADNAHCDNQMGPNNYSDFRVGVPYVDIYRGIFNQNSYGSACGSDNYGVTYYTNWTSPCPDTLYADQPILCDPGYATMHTGGAVFNGEYRWYRVQGGTEYFLQQTQDSFYTVFTGQTTTYRVYTCNTDDTKKSWSYREITIRVAKPNIQNISYMQPSCFGANNGSITVTASSPNSSTLTFSKDNGATYQSSNVFTGLGQGLYLIKVNDGICQVPDFGATVQLNDPPLLDAYLESVNQVLCNGQNSGSVNLTVGGGSPGYTFNWTKNGSAYASTEDLTQLGAGNYQVTVTDTKGCTDTVSTTISQPTAPLSVSGIATNVTCNGANDGSVQLTVSGGTTPYNIFWSNGYSGLNPVGLAAGVYTVNITDLNSCTANAVFTITSPAAMTLLFDTVQPVLCYGGNTGVISTAVSGGNGTYTYTWNPTTFSGSDITNATAGIYALTVSDGNNCSATGTVTITQPDTLQIGIENIENQSCYGDSSGIVMISIAGGVPTYSFNWSNGATTEDISHLAGGAYAVIVTDKNGCTANGTFNITGPSAALGLLINSVDAKCYGAHDGRAVSIPSGGTPPYTYFWSNGATTAIADLLPSGFYTLTVTDKNGCIIAGSAFIGQPDQIIITDSVSVLKCFGDANGSITTKVAGGIPPYSYAWSNGLASSSISGLTGGSYQLTITDLNNCTATASYTIQQPPALLSSVAGNNPDCNGNATGFAVVSPAGGTPPYSYLWNTNPAQTGVMAIKLAGNVTYQVVITDGNGCKHADSVALIEPTPVNVNFFPTNVTCFSGNDGTVTVHASGGNPGYHYYLNGVFNGGDSVFQGLTAANYVVVAEDINKCAGSALFSIAQPSQIRVNAGTDAIARNNEPVQLQATAYSIYGIKGFEWLPDAHLSCLNCSNPVAIVDSTTDFVVSAIDSTNCVEFDTVRITVKKDFIYFIPTAFTPNGDGLNDYFEVNILGAKQIATKIFNRWGEQVYVNDNMPNGIVGQPCTVCWDGKYKGKEVQMDSYTYQIEVQLYGETEKRKITGTITPMH